MDVNGLQEVLYRKYRCSREQQKRQTIVLFKFVILCMFLCWKHFREWLGIFLRPQIEKKMYPCFIKMMACFYSCLGNSIITKESTAGNFAKTTEENLSCSLEAKTWFSVHPQKTLLLWGAILPIIMEILYYCTVTQGHCRKRTIKHSQQNLDNCFTGRKLMNKW